MIVDPKGIDRPIQEMQNLFALKLWPNISEEKKRYYHRVFKNLKNGNIRPEVFTEINNQYSEVLWDKKLTIQSWFDVVDNSSIYDASQLTQNVGIVFIVNLKSLYPNLSHRAVEEAHLDVKKIISLMPREFEITSGITTGITAFGDFNIDNIKNIDMQPWHVFRFNCNVKYSLTC